MYAAEDIPRNVRSRSYKKMSDAEDTSILRECRIIQLQQNTTANTKKCQ